MRARFWSPAVTLCAVLSTAAAAEAQTPGSPPPSQADRPRWEVDAYGGLSLGRRSSGGSLMLPEPGAPIATSSPIFPSWRVPSWYFGDGAAFLNSVAEEFGVTGRITPLDAVLAPLGLDDAGSAAFGVRVRRPLRGRYSFEVGFDVMATPAGFSDTLVAGVEAARATFQSTFTALLATGPFAGPVISTASTVTDGSSREVALTGALVADLAPVAGFTPFVIAGGGVLAQAGDPPSVSVDGSYRFTIAGSVPIDETDHVTLRYAQRTVLVAVVGGGVRRDISPRWGIRIDGRVLLSPSTTRVSIDAAPLVRIGAPAGFIESFTYPNLQFSNNASTGRSSTLSGTLSSFDAFRGGWQARVRVTIGVVAKF